MGEHGLIPWRAGCAETCTSGSEGGPRKRAGRKAGTAPRPDPYSYVRTWEGWAYVATVIDVSSRRVVGLAMADHLRTSLASEALETALALRRPGKGLIFHTDRGCQYTSGEFRELLARNAIVQSLSRPGQCWDNAVAESFFSTLKEELLHRGVWPTRSAARRAIFEYVEVFYNRRRMHSALGYLSPADYEAEQGDLNTAQAA